MCSSSMASFRAIIIVTLASSTAKGLMSSAEELAGRDESEDHLRRVVASRDLGHPLEESGFKALQFTIGDVKEVPRTACRVQNRVILHALPEFAKALQRSRLPR